MDRINHLLSLFGVVDSGERAIRHLKKDLADVSIRKNIVDYYNVRAMVFDFIDVNKRYQNPKKKGRAIYYYKRAMQFGDLRAAYRYLKKYYTLGGMEKPALEITLAHPLSSIENENRKNFRDTLTPEQNRIIDTVLNCSVFNKKCYQHDIVIL